MAHTHIHDFHVRPRVTVASQRGTEIHRTHNMLVMTAIGSMIIVVVAALFMTMF